MPYPQRAERPSVSSDNSATSNVTDIHWTLSEISRQWGEMSHQLAAMDNWLLALEQQSPVTESRSLGPQWPQDMSELGDTPANCCPEMGSSPVEDPTRSRSPRKQTCMDASGSQAQQSGPSPTESHSRRKPTVTHSRRKSTESLSRHESTDINSSHSTGTVNHGPETEHGSWQE